MVNTTIDIETVTLFLITAKKEINKGNRIFINRVIDSSGKKISAKQGLLDIGIISSKELWNYILELKPEECFRISFDYDKTRDMNSEIFEFLKIINKKNVYIKLTMNDRGIICLSFHISNK